MVGTTLAEIRAHVDALASDDGRYSLVCARTGERPVPAADKRFASRAVARSAARATEQYRAALRRYDPRVPYYDVIVCEDGASPAGVGPSQATVVGASPPGSDRRRLVEFCHRVAAAVFETLSAGDHAAVESAVMDAYFALAEAVGDPDALCLRLLESMAVELEARLSPAAQAECFASAADRLRTATPTDDPVGRTFGRLRTVGLVDDFSRSPRAVDADAGTRSVDVHVSEYALSPRDGCLPVLPVVLDLYRRRADWSPSAADAVRTTDGWRLTVVLSTAEAPGGLATVPVGEEE